MTRRKETGWPAAPEPLAAPAVDNHTHLESIGQVAGGISIAQHIEHAKSVGVTQMVQVGCDLLSAQFTSELVNAHPELLGAIALHPNEAPLHARTADPGPDGLEPKYQPHHEADLASALAQIADLAASNGRIRAIGETGLDYFRGGPRAQATQQQSFRDHLALARELNLPVQIHDRDAHADVLRILREDGAPEAIVFHCFSGDAAMARECVAAGWYLSFSGTVTFKANEELRRAVREVPLSQLLVETDAPYLTPVPARGRPNAPYLLPYTVRAIAAVMQSPESEITAATFANSERVYGRW